jgi:hypothetical protein
MARYTVIIRGASDNSESGKNTFLERFAASYRINTEEARHTINTQKGAVYDFDEYDKAEKASIFLESIGGLTIIRDNETGIAPALPPGEEPVSEADRMTESDSSYSHLFKTKNTPQPEQEQVPHTQSDEENKPPWHIQTPEVIVETKPRPGRVYDPTVDPSGSMPVKAAFKPLQAIMFPDHCVGCFSEKPVNSISISVMPATAAASGGKIGSIGGGILGAFVKGPVGSAIFEGKGYRSYYNIPICPTCSKKLGDKEQKLLAGNSDLSLLGNYKVDTPYLTREIIKEFVVLTFYNNQYGEEFKKINSHYVRETALEYKPENPPQY